MKELDGRCGIEYAIKIAQVLQGGKWPIGNQLDGCKTNAEVPAGHIHEWSSWFGYKGNN